jgi:hypothetical protein
MKCPRCLETRSHHHHIASPGAAPELVFDQTSLHGPVIRPKCGETGHAVEVDGMICYSNQCQGPKHVKTIYLSGPMSGIPEFNGPAFAAYAEKYRARGWKVVSPPELDVETNDFEYESCIKRDMRVLVDGGIEAVYLLPGWQQSKGANLEKLLAELTGIPCFDAVTEEVVTELVREKVVTPRQTMPKDSTERKGVPLCSGVIDYFPAALAAVAKLSKHGNDKHNPGEPLHWARGKSMDHADCIARHLVDRGINDPDSGLSHTVEVAWRALALLQEELEAQGAPRARGAY